MQPHFTRIYTQHWIELPKEVRHHLAEKLGIVRTGISEVRDQTVISDGYSNEDLKGITEEKLAEYVGSTGDFVKLWAIAVSKANFELNPPKEIRMPEAITAAAAGEPIKMTMDAIAVPVAHKELAEKLINSTPETNNAKIENKENSNENKAGTNSISGTVAQPTSVPKESSSPQGGSTPSLS